MTELVTPENQPALVGIEPARPRVSLELLTSDVGEVEPIFVNLSAQRFFYKLVDSGLIPVENVHNSDGTFDVAHYNPADLPQAFQPYTQEGALVDYPASIAEINKLKAQRSALEKQAEALKARQNEIEEAVISSLAAQNILGTKVPGFSVGVLQQPRYSVLNWDTLYAHIKETDSFELLNRALKNASVKEMVQLGASSDDLARIGIDPEPFVAKSLSIRKAA